jgi:hypothetical protein
MHGLRKVYAGLRTICARFTQSLRRFTHGLRRVHIGLRKVYARFMHSLRKITQGLCRVYVGLRKFTRGLRRIYAGLRKFMRGLCRVYARFTPGLCIVYASLHKVYAEFTQSLLMGQLADDPIDLKRINTTSGGRNGPCAYVGHTCNVCSQEVSQPSSDL